MKAIITISNGIDCFNEYQATGSIPQKKIRIVEIDIPDPKLRCGEVIESINFKIEK